MNGRFCWSVIVHCGLLSLGLGGTSPTWAGPVTVDFTATIETIPDPDGEFAGANLKKGDSLTGTLTYDTQAQAVNSSSNPAQYNFTPTSSPAYASPLGFSLNIGGHVITPFYPGNMILQVQDDLASQKYPSMFTASTTVQDTTANPNQNALLASIGLGDSSGTVFSSTALPPSLDLSKFDAGQFVLQSTRTTRRLWFSRPRLMSADRAPRSVHRSRVP